MMIKLRGLLMATMAVTILPSSLVATEPRIVEPTLERSEVVVADVAVTDKPYGAGPTGVEDCTATVQKAVNDLHETGGGVVYLPAGRYRFDGHLTIPGRISSRGEGRLATRDRPNCLEQQERVAKHECQTNE